MKFLSTLFIALGVSLIISTFNGLEGNNNRNNREAIVFKKVNNNFEQVKVRPNYDKYECNFMQEGDTVAVKLMIHNEPICAYVYRNYNVSFNIKENKQPQVTLKTKDGDIKAKFWIMASETQGNIVIMLPVDEDDVDPDNFADYRQWDNILVDVKPSRIAELINLGYDCDHSPTPITK